MAVAVGGLAPAVDVDALPQPASAAQMKPRPRATATIQVAVARALAMFMPPLPSARYWCASGYIRASTPAVTKSAPRWAQIGTMLPSTATHVEVVLPYSSAWRMEGHARAHSGFREQCSAWNARLL